MDEEIDIYADLPSFNLEDNEHLVEKNEKITEKCTALEKQVAELTESLESLRKINSNLEVNISSLLQTARAEINRKDRMIAEIRQRLDDMQFRRDDYRRSSKPVRRSPSRTKRDNNFKNTKEVIEVTEIPDTTEFVCSDPSPSINDDDKRSNKAHKVNGFVNTLYGERLRKRILDEREEERRQKEQSKLESKKISESSTSEDKIENDTQNSLKTDSLKSDHKINNVPCKLKNKESSLCSNSNSHNEKNDHSSKHDHSDKKRHLEEDSEPGISNKKSKTNDGKSRYCGNRDNGSRSVVKNSCVVNRIDERTSAEIAASDNLNDYEIIDEYQAPVEKNVEIKNDDNNDMEDRHNRVAIRLMLLAEGIDPDLETKKSEQNEKKIVINDRRESNKKKEEISRNRSKSRNRYRDHRSRSRTPIEYRKNRRQSRQRENRYRRGRDRFDRRRDMKNKDNDNLSEFSREICELKETIEQKVDDRFIDRNRRCKSSNRQKRNDERSYKTSRSGTPDSNRSCSKEKTIYKSRDEKQYGRSRSRERYKNRNSGKRTSNSDDFIPQHSKVSGISVTEKVESISTKDSLQVKQNPETESLLSLEDGEIIDSTDSSPVKIVNTVKNSTDKPIPLNIKINSLDSKDATSNIVEEKYSPPLIGEIEINKNNAIPLLEKQQEKSISELNPSTGLLSVCLNSSKDERIENIAEFIANFDSTVVSENNNKEEMLNVQQNAVDSESKIPNEKIRCMVNNVSQDTTKDNSLLSPVLIENINTVNIKNVNCNNSNDDWCLIAIDSPIKNFEENRKNRIIAQNLQIMEKLEPLNIVLTDNENANELVEVSNDSSKIISPDETHGKIYLENDKITSDKTVKPLLQSVRNIIKSKPPVLTSLRSLRSTYRKGRKEIVLSDSNSEQCKKISMTRQINSATERSSNEFEKVEESKNNLNGDIVDSNGVEKLKSEITVIENLDQGYNNSKKENEKESRDDLFADENDSVNTPKDEENPVNVQSTITSKKKIDLLTVVDDNNKKNDKSKSINNIKTHKETVTKINGDLKPEIDNNTVNESKSKQDTDCKKDLIIAGKANVPKSSGTKIKTGSNVEKNRRESGESNINKILQNNMKPGKNLPKVKDESNDNKQKKESQKLIVSARRRKPVHSEDSSTSTSSSTVIRNSLNLFNDISNNSENSIDKDKEKASNSANMDNDNLIEYSDEVSVKSDNGNDGPRSELSNVKEKT